MHVRKITQDAFLEHPDVGLRVVAGGMGGHSEGTHGCFMKQGSRGPGTARSLFSTFSPLLGEGGVRGEGGVKRGRRGQGKAGSCILHRASSAQGG